MAEEQTGHGTYHAEHGGAEAGPGAEAPGETSEPRAYAEEAREATRATAEEAGAKVQEYGRQLRQQGYEMLWDQQQVLAGWLSRVGDAFGQSAEQLRQTNDTSVAACMESTGDRAQGAATYLREHEPREVMDNAGEFARQHPGWVIGGALLTGFMASRFIKAAWYTESGKAPTHESQQPRSAAPTAEPAEQPGAPSTAPEPSQRPSTAAPPPEQP